MSFEIEVGRIVMNALLGTYSFTHG